MPTSMKHHVLGLMIAILILTANAQAEFRSTGVPRYDQAARSAVAWLLTAGQKAEEKEVTFIAYALFKAGEHVDSPLVARGVEEALKRANETGYSGYDHAYLAGVDAMLLADIDETKYATAIQKMVDHIQSSQRSDGSWSDSPSSPADSSMAQYALLCIWAGNRAGCTMSPEILERAAAWHFEKGNSDGGWAYRPGITAGPEMGLSQHTTSMAGAGSLAIIRTLFYGPKTLEKKKVEAQKVLGVLDKIDLEAEQGGMSKFPNFKSKYTAAAFDSRTDRGFNWVETRFSPTAKEVRAKNYFYYALERAAALHGMSDISGRDWFSVYADGLLTHQAPDGSFDKTYLSARIDTAFAILFLMRSTQQILDKQYGLGLQLADRGNPFGEKKKKEPTELDRLIEDIGKMDIPDIDESSGEVADEIVRSVLAVDDPETLVGQEDKLKSLMKHPNAKVRSAAVWALGRTGDFKLVPLMLDGIRDNSIDVNIEAIQALRFIARKPQGFGETLAPFASLGGADQIEQVSPEERLRLATPWREKALRDWSNWYFGVRPFEERGGLDELQVK